MMRLRTATENISESYELCLEVSFSKLITEGAMEEKVEEVIQPTTAGGPLELGGSKPLPRASHLILT